MPKLFQKIPMTRGLRTSWAMNNALMPAYMVTMTSEVDATCMDQLREQYKKHYGKAPSYTAMVMKAAALCMEKNPQANRAVLGLPFMKKLIQFNNVDISVAVEKSIPGLPGQALAETITDTGNKGLLDLTLQLRHFASSDTKTNERWRLFHTILTKVPRPFSNWLINMPYWFPSMWVKHRGCACWVNAPSRAGPDTVHTTWPWPITFSFGYVKERPVVIDGKLEVRRTMPLVMVFDRRTMGGGPASRIFVQLKDLLHRAEETLVLEIPVARQKKLFPVKVKNGLVAKI